MPLDPEKIQEYTGIKADTDEAFVEAFSKKFYTKEQIYKDENTKNEFFGRAFGSTRTGIRQVFEANEIDISGDDLEKQPLEAVVKVGLQKLNEKFALKAAELEKTAGLTADEKLKELKDSLDKKEQKIKDYERVVKEKGEQLETLEKTNKGKLKEFKLGLVYRDAENSFTWNPDKDDWSKKGWLAEMKEKYTIDLEDNDEPNVFDRKTGERVKAEGTHSAFVHPIDFYKQEALKAGMAAVNKNAGKPVIKQPEKNNPQDNPNQIKTPIFGATPKLATTGYKPSRK